jgi:hypothetical protein
MDLDSALCKWRPFVVERMVDDGAFTEPGLDSMSDDLDVVGKERPGMRDFEMPGGVTIVWPRSGRDWSTRMTEIGISVNNLRRGQRSLKVSKRPSRTCRDGDSPCTPRSSSHATYTAHSHIHRCDTPTQSSIPSQRPLAED